MSMTVSVRVEHKNMSLAKIQRRHDLRLLGESTPKYIDRQRTADNSVIIEPIKEGELKKICLERRALGNKKRAMKSSAAVSSIGLISFGTEAQDVIKSLSKDEQDRLFKESAEKVAKELNTTLTGLVVHRDEASPHAHFQMPAVSLNGKPVCKVLGDKQSFAKLQDIAGAVYSEYGIHRGTSKSVRIAAGEDYSKTVHMSVRQLHETLPTDIAKKQEQLNELERQIAEQQAKIAKNERLLGRTLVKITKSDLDLAKIKKNADIYECRVANAKAELLKLEQIAAQVRSDIQRQESELKKREEALAKKEEAVNKKEEVVNKKDAMYKKFANQFTKITDETADRILKEAGVSKPPKIKTLDILQRFIDGGLSSIKSMFKMTISR